MSCETFTEARGAMTDSTNLQRARRPHSGRTILALMLREMATTYGRSPGGYLWAIVEPVGALLVFTLVISMGLRLQTPSVGVSFMLFYATGFLPFTLFTQTAGKMARAIQFSRQLLKYPVVHLTDAVFARFLVNLLTHVMVFFIVVTGICQWFDECHILNIPAIALGMGLAAVFGFGIGILNCLLFSVFPVWESLWGILTRPLFLLSTVIYAFDDIPGQFRDLVWFNPMIHAIGLVRRGFYPTYDAAYASAPYVLGLALGLTVLGLALLGRWYLDIVNRG